MDDLELENATLEKGWREESDLAQEDGSDFYPRKPRGMPSADPIPMQQVPETRSTNKWADWFEAQHRKGAPRISDPVSIRGERGTILAMTSAEWDHYRGDMFSKGEIRYRIRLDNGSEIMLYWPEDFKEVDHV